jgi:hypothetical protein
VCDVGDGSAALHGLPVWRVRCVSRVCVPSYVRVWVHVGGWVGGYLVVRGVTKWLLAQCLLEPCCRKDSHPHFRTACTPLTALYSSGIELSANTCTAGHCRRCAANKPPLRANNQRWFVCTTSQIGLSLVPHSAVGATSNTPLPTTLAVRAQHWPLPTHCWPWLTEHRLKVVCCGTSTNCLASTSTCDTFRKCGTYSNIPVAVSTSPRTHALHTHARTHTTAVQEMVLFFAFAASVGSGSAVRGNGGVGSVIHLGRGPGARGGKSCVNYSLI